MRNQVLHGDVLEQLRKLPDECVQAVCTSPPYYALRTYLRDDHPDKAKEIGLEQSPHDYVAKMVEVFREVRRVLRSDGVCWLNLGDSYANDAKWGGATSGKHAVGLHGTPVGRTKKKTGFKAKDLMMIPSRVAIALQDDGWWIRADVIWQKGTLMPESVQDRVTRSHEYIFMLTKAANYYYDAEAIREPAGDWVNDDPRYQEEADEVPRSEDEPAFHAKNGKPTTGLVRKPVTSRNKRSVWNINPKPYRGAHFATMPEEIPRLAIKSSSSQMGACPACGSPWERVIERGESHYSELKGERSWREMDAEGLRRGVIIREGEGGQTRNVNGTVPSLHAAPRREMGWQPTCRCPEHKPVPCLILDPFAGSGTTLRIAKMLGRDYVGCELNPDYIPLITERVRAAHELQAGRDIFELMMAEG